MTEAFRVEIRQAAGLMGIALDSAVVAEALSVGDEALAGGFTYDMALDLALGVLRGSQSLLEALSA